MLTYIKYEKYMHIFTRWTIIGKLFQNVVLMISHNQNDAFRKLHRYEFVSSVCVCVCVWGGGGGGGGGGSLINLTITKSGIVIILYYIVLYCIVLYHIISYHIISIISIISYHIILYYVDELHFNTHGVVLFYLTNFPPKYLGPTGPKWSPYWLHEFC